MAHETKLTTDMEPAGKSTENLFSYGTLQDDAVQLATFGRKPASRLDALVGYTLRTIRITDQEFVARGGAERQRTLQFTGSVSDVVDGKVLTLTRSELEQADAYEPRGYQRKLVRLRSGLNAWVYTNDEN